MDVAVGVDAVERRRVVLVPQGLDHLVLEVAQQVAAEKPLAVGIVNGDIALPDVGEGDADDIAHQVHAHGEAGTAVAQGDVRDDGMVAFPRVEVEGDAVALGEIAQGLPHEVAELVAFEGGDETLHLVVQHAKRFAAVTALKTELTDAAAVPVGIDQLLYPLGGRVDEEVAVEHAAHLSDGLGLLGGGRLPLVQKQVRDEVLHRLCTRQSLAEVRALVFALQQLVDQRGVTVLHKVPRGHGEVEG